MEKWKKIIDSDGYEISNYGQVRNSRGLILKQQKSNSGYMMTCIYYDGKRKNQTIHRLVAKHFIENPNGKKQVNHIDGNKTNNVFYNLEWATASENVAHAFMTGIMDNSRVKAAQRMSVIGSKYKKENGDRLKFFSAQKAIKVQLINIQDDKEDLFFNSIKHAEKEIKTHSKTLILYSETQNIFRGNYFVKLIKPTQLSRCQTNKSRCRYETNPNKRTRQH